MTHNILRDSDVQEQLDACSGWLQSMHADLSFGLKSPEDALKLWRYALAHPELAEFCDEQTGEPGDWQESNFIEAIGYNPFTITDNPWQE